MMTSKPTREHEPCFGPVEVPKLLAMMFDYTDVNSKTMHVMLTHACASGMVIRSR